MNNKTTIKTVLTMSVIIVVLAAISNSVSTVQAHTPNFLPYGEVGAEDELYFVHDGMMYINTGANLGEGNGMFMSESDISTKYSVDDAIQRFGIDEDVHSFSVQPSQYSNVELTFMFNDETLNFELIGASSIQ